MPGAESLRGHGNRMAVYTFRGVSGACFWKREMVIFYNIATGARFLTPEMEQTFRKVAELEKDDDASSKDPVAAAKAGLAAKRQIPREPELCLPLIEKVLNKMERAAVVIESAHFITPESS